LSYLLVFPTLRFTLIRTLFGVKAHGTLYLRLIPEAIKSHIGEYRGMNSVIIAYPNFPDTLKKINFIPQ